MIHYITTNGIGNAWVAAELKHLTQAGIPIQLHSMRNPGKHFFGAAWATAIHRNTTILYPLSVPAVALAILLAPFRFRLRFFAALYNAFFGQRENLRARIGGIAHLLVACWWAPRISGTPVACIHSQWIHSCGTIGMYAAWLLNVPFSFTGHAADLFRDRVALRDKILRAEFIVCISGFHRQFYLDQGAQEQQFITVHCGIDVEQFQFRQRTTLSRKPHIVTVGRLVEKKGNGYLIDACRLLRDRGINIRCTIAGDGPLTEALRSRVHEQGLEDIVCVTGKAIQQEELANFMQTGDIFAQPCVWSNDNDVDGTPRTLMEAMACGVPSVATRLVGIPDIIEDGASGLLVEPNDAESLADAISRLVHDADLIARLSRGGREKIEQDFKLPECLTPLETRFRSILQFAKNDCGLFEEQRRLADAATGSE